MGRAFPESGPGSRVPSGWACGAATKGVWGEGRGAHRAPPQGHEPRRRLAWMSEFRAAGAVPPEDQGYFFLLGPRGEQRPGGGNAQ